MTLISCNGSDLPLLNAEQSRDRSPTPTQSPTPSTPNQPNNQPESSLVLKPSQGGLSVSLPAKVSIQFNAISNTGRPVTDLTLDDFTLLENGNKISKAEAQPKLTQLQGDYIYSTLLLLDFSGSVVDSALETLKLGAVNFIQSVFDSATQPGQIEVAIALFDGSQELDYITTNSYYRNPRLLIEIINQLDASFIRDRSTNLHGAVQKGMTNLNEHLNYNLLVDSKRSVAGAMVLFTDGRDEAALFTEQEALESIDNADPSISVLTIGLGEDIDSELLALIGKDGFQQVDRLEDLVDSFFEISQFIAAETNSRYQLDYCSPKRSGDQNMLTIQVSYDDLFGALEVPFSANTFTAGCVLD